MAISFGTPVQLLAYINCKSAIHMRAAKWFWASRHDKKEIIEA